MRHRFTLPALRRVAAVAIASALVLTGCSQQQAAPSSSSSQPKTSEIVLASTTSTQDSGLFSVLIPAFEKDNPGYKVKVVAVGSGEALKLGEKKDADVLLVHSKKAELKFVDAGFGGPRKDVMYNDFVIVGPKADPARIARDTSAADAFKKIAAAKATFVARGDGSGTATKEQSIWTSASVEPTRAPDHSWYLSTGQGMGEVLKLTAEKQGYTLSDRATYLTLKDSLDGIVVLVEGDKALFNQYGVIPVAGAKNAAGAEAFAAWITGPKGQEVVRTFGVEKFGRPLFIPNAK